VDALSVWDLIKAIGRDAKWAFKRRIVRHLDGGYGYHEDSGPELEQSGQQLSEVDVGIKRKDR
jgi:hypothetical protein